MISVQAVKKAVGIMSLMEFFPGSPDAQAALIEILGNMCENDEEVLWLARRVTGLCPKWPGVQILWQIRFSKYAPRNAAERGIDRETTSTLVFPEGVPSERESHPAQIAEASVKAIAGAVQSLDHELQGTVTELAKSLGAAPMPKFRARTPEEIRVDGELRQLYRMGDGEAK